MIDADVIDEAARRLLAAVRTMFRPEALAAILRRALEILEAP